MLLIAGTAHAVAAAPAHGDRVLRVCADPNNLPYSSEHATGFEQEIANVLAHELGARVEYTWWPQRRGFIRNTLKAEKCDVVIGVPKALDMVRTTAPYYRSTFVFVSRDDRALDLRSLDDPRLRELRIGVQLVGDDGANPAPAHCLAARGIVDNVVGFTVYGDYAQDSPAADVIRAVADGKVDVAIVWGPLAGGAAKRSKTPLRIVPVAEREDRGLPLAFDIAIGVRRPDKALAAELDRALAARKVDIEKILDRWGVPRISEEDHR
ncbi:MAG TPA: substrate-binding domain-containing protein [Kofleriaceae bacterium]|nr:substrate-binding domain-containing protein [Kofleriaceae bacterium]